MAGRQFVRRPHRQPMPHIRQRDLVRWKRAYFLVVNQEPVGVFNFEVVRIGRFKLGNATLNGVGHHDSQRFFQQALFVL